MRLGGFFEEAFSDPEAWTGILKQKGYRAAYFPFRVSPGGMMPDDTTVRAYADAAEQADILIAEVGAWGRNCMAKNEAERQLAITDSQKLLAIADLAGACCLVNSAGWHDNGAESFSDDTFALIVDTVRSIIDAVAPTRTFFTLELVPNIFPHSVDSYLQLLQAVDRKAFAVHLDPANIIDNAWKYHRNGEFLRDCFRRLGPRIKSCHAKDVVLEKGPVIHISETRPGLGGMDYRTFLREAWRINPDMPIMLEHLETNGEYLEAANHLRAIAAELEQEGTA
jgi:sugar phosphate isomerase/epimerase